MFDRDLSINIANNIYYLKSASKCGVIKNRFIEQNNNDFL